VVYSARVLEQQVANVEDLLEGLSKATITTVSVE